MLEPYYRADRFPLARRADFDFDETAAHTYVPSPSGWTVDRAYEEALRRVLPTKRAAYRARGGLQALDVRSPVGVVSSLIPRASLDELGETTAAVVQIKLEVLINEVGRAWPRPVKGFLAAWSAIQQARADAVEDLEKGREPSALINTAFVTTGHASFILRTLHQWGIARSEIDWLITYDLADAVAHTTPLEGVSVERLLKPETFQLELVCEEWGRTWGVFDPAALRAARARAVLIGDDPVGDGRAASGAGVRYIELRDSHSEEDFGTFLHELGIGA